MTKEVGGISGGLYHFIDNKKVIDSIREAGRKTIVFVEGKYDKKIFELVYEKYTDKIEFIIALNCRKVKEYLEGCVQNIKEERYFGIIDRDFRTDKERENEMQEDKYKDKLYILTRYAIENYLIESEVLLKFLNEVISIETIKGIIHNIFKSLINVMAGNWLLLDLDFGKTFLLDENIPTDKEIILKKLNKKIKEKIEDDEISEETIKEKYEKYHSIISKMQDNVDELQKYINGKHFFHHFRRKIKNTWNKTLSFEDLFLKLYLTRILKDIGMQKELAEAILRFIKILHTRSEDV